MIRWGKRIETLFISGVFAVCLAACGSVESGARDQQFETQISEVEEGVISELEENGGSENIAESKTEILQFVDAYGESYETEILSDIEKHTYDWEFLQGEGVFLSYEDDQYESRLGIDVSYHQGDINWERVKAAGAEFVFIRIGYRGYGSAGNVCQDAKFYEYLKGAQDAGLDVGVYFFSQAINEEEAREEADFVIDGLSGITLQLPVVYDPERIRDDIARTDDVSGEQFTKNTIVFCDALREAGYEPMIYSNMLWEAFEYDLEQLSDLPIWYADYEQHPQTPYYFSFWQYAEDGSIDGVNGKVDLNIQFIRKNQEE